PAAEAARTRLLEAADQYVEALGRDEKLNEGLAEDLRKAPRELIEHLLKGPHAGSRSALDLAKKTMGELKDDGRDYDAFLIGKRIALISEQAFGLKSQITQDIVAMILPEALKFTTDAERQDWLARAENLDGRDDDRLIQVLLGHGATEAALHIVRRKNKVSIANAVGDYELLSVLGTQADLTAYADVAQANMLKASEQTGCFLCPTAADIKYLRPLREGMLGYAKALRGACDAGLAARDRIAAAFGQLLNVVVAQQQKKQESTPLYAFL